MTGLDRSAKEIRAVLRAQFGVDLSHEDAEEIARRVFEAVREPPEQVVLSMCEFECNRKDCRIARACQGHQLLHHKQRWEVAISAILSDGDDG